MNLQKSEGITIPKVIRAYLIRDKSVVIWLAEPQPYSRY